MECIKIFLILIYGMIRSLPFMITGYLILSTKNSPAGSNMMYGKLQKAFSVILGIGTNAVVFLGMHYYHYKDVQILGYIKNVWGLNFYYHDVEYFVMSAALGILLSVALGIVLRIFFCDAKNSLVLDRKQECVILTAGSVALLLAIAGFSANNFFNSQIVISEVCSNNETLVLNQDAQVEDYIELHNTGIFPCQMDGLYLSDDPYNLKKMSLEGLVIPADGLLVIPCAEDINSFAISNKGEVIYLSSYDGQIFEHIEVVELENDMSYSKMDGAVWTVGVCTPGTVNEIKKVDMPVLSHKSGFYNKEFDLEIGSASDTIIYYTLDGSVPNEGSYLYDGAIHVYDKSSEENVWKAVQNVVREWKEYTPVEESVAKAFLIRAIAMDNLGNKSDVVTATYFVGAEEFRDRDVVSLIADPEDLFNEENGIYVTGTAYDEWYLNGEEGEQPLPNFRQRGREWEREAVFELFDDSISIFQQNVGIRIQGASGRESSKKRFSVYARKEYSGSNVLDRPLFYNEMQSHSIVLRDEIADVICQSLLNDRGIPYQRYRRVALFLNGEHWYNSYIREKYNEQYFENYYGIEEDNLIVIEGNAVSCGVETDMARFNEFYQYIGENDFTEDAAYRQLENKIDIQNYIDFLITNIYCTNMDFDMENTKNVVMWRSKEPEDDKYGDGRWRFALYDMDSIQWNSLSYYGVENRAAIDPISQKPQHADKSYNQGVLYSALRKNHDFCKQFVVTCMDLINTNFSIETVNEKLRPIGKNSTWLESFFEKRPAYMKEYLAKEFELTGSIEKVALYNEDETRGTITINTVTPSMREGTWSGEYFTDYPVTVTANPAKGYEFTGWTGCVSSEEMTIEVPVTKGGIELRAEFRKVE